MYAQNEQVHVGAWPSFSLYDGGAYALGSEVNTSAARIYAVEGQCFVLAPCSTVSQEMVDEMCTTDLQKALLKTGGGYARVFGPDGQQLHECLSADEEGLIYADIDLGLISVAKAVADPAAHYSRPDVTQLVHNKAPQRAVLNTTPPADPAPASEAPRGVEEPAVTITTKL